MKGMADDDDEADLDDEEDDGVAGVVLGRVGAFENAALRRSPVCVGGRGGPGCEGGREKLGHGHGRG